MANKPTKEELQQLKDAVQWKLDHGDVTGADNLAKVVQLVTPDPPPPDPPK